MLFYSADELSLYCRGQGAGRRGTRSPCWRLSLRPPRLENKSPNCGTFARSCGPMDTRADYDYIPHALINQPRGSP